MGQKKEASEPKALAFFYAQTLIIMPFTTK